MGVSFLIDAFHFSDGFGKFIVCVLVGFSWYCWSVTGGKCSTTSSLRKSCQRFLELFAKNKFTKPLCILGQLDDQNLKRKKLESPLADLSTVLRDTLLATLKPDSTQKAQLLDDGVLPRPLQQAELDALHAAVAREMSRQIDMLEKGQTGMSTSISIAPMLGLLGTVTGVLSTFVGIHKAGGRPDIAAIAPGIAGALLTTVLGLFVAIPAIFMNNIAVSSTNKVITDLELFAEDLFNAILNASEAAAEKQRAEAKPPQQTPNYAPFPPNGYYAPPPPVGYAPPPPSPADYGPQEAPQTGFGPETPTPTIQRPLPPPQDF